MDKSRKPYRSSSPITSASPPDCVDRCLKLGLGGSLLPGPQRLGHLVTSRVTPTHQCSGMPSSDSLPKLTASSRPHVSTDKIGQLHGGLSHKQTGIEQESSTQLDLPETSQAVHLPSLDSECPPHTGSPQLLGGFPVEESHSQIRMGTLPSLLQKADQPQIDLFAHPGNAKLPQFGCLFKHPSATIIDALTTDWNRWHSIYLFPPPDLIPLCLQKLDHFKGRGLFVAPLLISAPWWPAFAERCSLLDAPSASFNRYKETSYRL